MSPKPTLVEMSHVTPSPTGSDITAGEMAAPMGLTPTPPATPSPPPNQDAGDAPLPPASPPHHHVNNNHNHHEEEPILPDLHPFMPLPPYRSELDEVVPVPKNLPQVLRQVCGTNELRSVRQLRLRVISREMSLQRLCLHVPNLRDLTLDGSSLLSLRDLGCGLVHLRKLRVARCGLDSLDGLFGLMSLRELHAADNDIDDIGACSALQYIKRIDLSRNRITDISYVSFLKVCPALKHVSLAGCPAAEDSCYRAEVRRRMPQLVTLDGEPLRRGAARQPDGNDDSDDSDDSDDDGDGKGGGVNDASPFSSASEDGGESDNDVDLPFRSGAGDAGSRPASGRRVSTPLDVLLNAPAKETLPPLQHSMTQLPPLRPLHPLPPIGSQSRPSSASAGSSAKSCTPVVSAAKRPTTGLNRQRKTSTADAGVSSTPMVVKVKQRATAGDTNRNVIPGPAVQASAESDSAAVRTPELKADKERTNRASTLEHGQPGSSSKQPRLPVRPAPSKTAAAESSVNNSKESHTAGSQPDRIPVKKLTREDCLTLDLETRVKRWTDEILDNPALENLERLSVLAAEDEDHCSDDEEAVDDPGPSTSSRR